MEVVRPGSHLVTVTDGGYAKRTSVTEWRTQGRNTYGVTAMKLVEQRGSLVGALICEESDELYAIASNGVVIRTRVDQVRATGRATMGVSLMDLAEGDSVVGVARSADLSEDDEVEDADAADLDPQGGADPQQSATESSVGGEPEVMGQDLTEDSGTGSDADE
jgi:DNA gyrase subunit A